MKSKVLQKEVEAMENIRDDDDLTSKVPKDCSVEDVIWFLKNDLKATKQISGIAKLSGLKVDHKRRKALRKAFKDVIEYYENANRIIL